MKGRCDLYVDFAQIKAATTMADVVKMLGLKLKQNGNQWRGKCPICKLASDRSLAITEHKGFYCFQDGKGGDCIALVAHISGISAKEAALAIAKWKGLTPADRARSQAHEPESEAGGMETKKLQPLAYLEHDHDAVTAIGFDPEIAKELGIGYAPKGLMRGTVAVPVRDEHGDIRGYIGITDAKLPPDFMQNVLPFKKRA